jgi:hypothetical protein
MTVVCLYYGHFCGRESSYAFYCLYVFASVDGDLELKREEC